MSKEQLELLDEVYRCYSESHWTPPSNPNGKLLSDQLWSLKPMEHSKESFINKCKTDNEYSEKWGLKIEERELSLSERTEYKKKRDCIVRTFAPYTHQMLDGSNIPTKLITITYKDKTIESYV